MRFTSQIPAHPEWHAVEDFAVGFKIDLRDLTTLGLERVSGGKGIDFLDDRLIAPQGRLDPGCFKGVGDLPEKTMDGGEALDVFDTPTSAVGFIQDHAFVFQARKKAGGAAFQEFRSGLLHERVPESQKQRKSCCAVFG